MSFANVIWWSW